MNCLLLCLFGISTCFVANAVAREALVGGIEVAEAHFPYQVALLVYSLGLTCGGGIINEKFILTAAHCVVKENGEFVRLPMSIIAGTNNLRKVGPPAMTIPVKQVFIPREYDAKNPDLIADIAVLKLQRPLVLSKHIRNIKYAKHSDESYGGTKAKIAGFGWDEVEMIEGKEKGKNSNSHLRYSETNVISNFQCQQSYGGHKNISDRQLCAKVKQRENQHRGVCIGDSGGPLVHAETIIGILSNSPEGCTEKERPAIYTRVTEYQFFINHVMGEGPHDDSIAKTHVFR